MGKFLGIEWRGDWLLSIPDICKEIGTSPRTLTVCCNAYLGTSPKRWLMLRRMHRLRRDLQRATPDETTVTEIATRYGFYNFGWLARRYKALFGELPSVTLGEKGAPVTVPQVVSPCSHRTRTARPR